MVRSSPNRYACINRIANQRFYQKSRSISDNKIGTDPVDDLRPVVMVTSHRKRVRNNNGRSPPGDAQQLSIYKRHELQQFHQRKYQSNIIILSRPPVNAANINKGSREKKNGRLINLFWNGASAITPYPCPAILPPPGLI